MGHTNFLKVLREKNDLLVQSWSMVRYIMFNLIEQLLYWHRIPC